MAFQAGGPHAQDRALEAIAYALFEQRRVPAHRALGEAGAGEPLRMTKDYRVVPARRGAGDRLQHVPDLELLPGSVRLAGHRQRRRGQAAPAGRAAAGDHRRSDPRRRCGTPASTRPGDAGRRGRRRGAGQDAGRCTPRCSSSTTPAARRSATGSSARPRRRQAGLHREGRRQHGRRRLDRRPARRAGQPRVLVLALHRPDVHDAAERLPAARRHRDRRGAPVLRRVRRRAGRRARPADGDDAKAVELLGATVNDGVLDAGRALRRPGVVAGGAVVLDSRPGQPPALPRRGRAHAGAGRARRGRRATLHARSASGRSPS